MKEYFEVLIILITELFRQLFPIPLIFFNLAFGYVLLLIKKNTNIKWKTIGKIWLITHTTPIVLVAILLLAFCIKIQVDRFVKSPMTVHYHNFQGNYVINRDYFKGENADWQYDHYRLKIKKDTLYLYIMKNGKVIKTYKRNIKYDKHYKFTKQTVIEFPTDWGYEDGRRVSDSLYSVRADSIRHAVGHEALMRNPLLHADPFKFNLILRSERYGNMFFTKGKWKERKK